MYPQYEAKNKTVSISLVSRALIALEEEIQGLDRDEQILHQRLALIASKRSKCTDTMMQLLNNSPQLIYQRKY